MKHCLIAALTASACSAASADGPEFKFTGFGTLGAVVTNTDSAQYRSNLRQDKGAGKTPDFGVDSRLGLQENVKFNDTFSAAGQLLTLSRDGSVRPNVEWLYGQASVLPGLDLRVGRMVLPAFLISDSRAVGYSSTWVRAPRDVYDWYPSTSFDGGQALYRVAVADFNVQLQGSLGKASSKLYNFGAPVLTLDFNKLSSISATVDRGDWTARVGQTLSRELNIEAIGVNNIRDAFTEAGLQYDNGQIVAMVEYMIRRADKGGNDNSNGYYASAGYRIGGWTPYAIYSHYTPKNPGLQAPDSNSKSLGARWDVFKNVALKAQLDHTLSESGFIQQTPAFAAHPTPVNVFSLTADFIF